MPARSSTASGARTGLLATALQSTRARVSSSRTHKKYGSDYLQWPNLAYLAVSRVEYLSQLERVVYFPEEGSVEALRLSPCSLLTEQQLRKVIQRKLLAYKQQDQAKGLRFNLKVDHVLELKEAQNNHCAACNIELLWANQPKDTQEFSADRLDNSVGHIRDNIRLPVSIATEKEGSLRSALEDPIWRKLSVGWHNKDFLADKAMRRPILQVMQHGIVGLGDRASSRDHTEGFLPVNLVTSLQSCYDARQPSHPLSRPDLKGASSPVRIDFQRAALRGSGSSVLRSLGSGGCEPDRAGPRPRVWRATGSLHL